MSTSTKNSEPELASGWPISRVNSCIAASDKSAILLFLKTRYEERFFTPIRTLREAPRNFQGFGFAVMALCSLLIETLQCYRQGLPTTSRTEWTELDRLNPPQDSIPKDQRQNGCQAFQSFFDRAEHKILFCGIGGKDFYKNVRNGLLHQAQTKGGWKIRRRRLSLWNDEEKIIDRDKFARALESAFDLYLDELRKAAWDDGCWKMARRKIWWLIKSSE